MKVLEERNDKSFVCLLGHSTNIDLEVPYLQWFRVFEQIFAPHLHL